MTEEDEHIIKYLDSLDWDKIKKVIIVDIEIATIIERIYDAIADFIPVKIFCSIQTWADLIKDNIIVGKVDNKILNKKIKIYPLPRIQKQMKEKGIQIPEGEAYALEKDPFQILDTRNKRYYKKIIMFKPGFFTTFGKGSDIKLENMKMVSNPYDKIRVIEIKRFKEDAGPVHPPTVPEMEIEYK